VLGDVREVGAGVVAAPAECVRAFGYVFYCVIFRLALINA